MILEILFKTVKLHVRYLCFNSLPLKLILSRPSSLIYDIICFEGKVWQLKLMLHWFTTMWVEGCYLNWIKAIMFSIWKVPWSSLNQQARTRLHYLNLQFDENKMWAYFYLFFFYTFWRILLIGNKITWYIHILTSFIISKSSWKWNVKWRSSELRQIDTGIMFNTSHLVSSERKNILQC